MHSLQQHSMTSHSSSGIGDHNSFILGRAGDREPPIVSSNIMVQYNDNSFGKSASADNSNETIANRQTGEDNKEENRKPPYSMHSVLHYLQHEWSRYELERSQWEMERAELKARISFLVGERKGQENLKNCLVRRIKMLEFSLQQERLKLYRLTHNGEDLQDDDEPQFNQGDESFVPMDVDAIENDGAKKNKNIFWQEARQMLRQYLQEIGYTEKVLDIRSFRVKHLLGLMPDVNNPGLDDSNNGKVEDFLKVLNSKKYEAHQTQDSQKMDDIDLKQKAGMAQPGGQIKKQQKRRGSTIAVVRGTAKPGEQSLNIEELAVDNDNDSSDSDNEDSDKNLDGDAVEVANEFSFLKDCKPKKGSNKDQRPKRDEWTVNQDTLEQMKERFRSEQEHKRQVVQQQHSETKNYVANSNLGEFSQNMDSSLLNAETVEEFADIKDNFAETELEDDSDYIRWNIRYTLRSHYDSIRAMQFHPTENCIITASEDGTAKLWDLNHSAGGGKESGKSTHSPQPSTGVIDVEPIYTFRGHKGPVLAMDMDGTGDYLYTAGLDGTICCWTIPHNIGSDIYQSYDQNVLQERLSGHKDSIWAIAYHSSSNRLISASADGTIRMWMVGVAEGMQPLIKVFDPPRPEARPKSIDIVSVEPQQLLTAYNKVQCSILDLDTGKNVINFQFGEDELGSALEINKVLSHPTMPVTITASEDRKIRYFDNNTGRLITSHVAHVEGIASIAIDLNGMYLLSGSHDGSLRLWNTEKKICIQEIAGHRKKLDEGVLCVAFHPSRPLIGSAGADSLAKVFGTRVQQA